MRLHSFDCNNYFRRCSALLTNWWRNRPAWNKWISSSAFWAAAGWYMINYITASTLPTCSRAWIYTTLITAGFVAWTFCIHGALRTAVGVRVSEVVWQTRALTIVTLCVGTTWWWIAGISHNWLFDCEWCKKIRSKCERNNLWSIIAHPF